MRLSKISRKLSSVIAGGLIALILPLSNCKLPERTRTIEPVAWADVNRDGIKDAIIKKINNQKVFLHMYIEYEDFVGNPYFFRSSYLLTGLSSRPTFSVIGYDCNWEMIDASEESIK